MDAVELQKRMQAMTARGASGQAMADFAEDLVAQTYEDARRTARVASGLVAGVFAVIAGGALVGALGSALGSSTSPPDLRVAVVLGLVAVVLAAVGAVQARNSLALRPPPRELAASGVAARLTVRDYRTASGGFRLRTPSSSVDFTRVAIDLDVVTAEGASYPVTVREYLMGRAFAMLAPGATLSGFVDRADPARIFIDWRARGASG